MDVHEGLTHSFNLLFEEEREELGDLPGECERLFKAYLRFWSEDQDTYSVAELPDGTPAIEFMVRHHSTSSGLRALSSRVGSISW
jgi:hypothetical protein